MLGTKTIAKKFADRLHQVGEDWKAASKTNKESNTNLEVASNQHVVGTTLCVIALIIREVFETE